MPRPTCPRYIDEPARYTCFQPTGASGRDTGTVVLGMDELEAIRLADREGLYQDAAAERMNISRPTFGRLIASARAKVAEALVEGKTLCIEGGVVEMPKERQFECAGCGGQWSAPFGTGRPGECPTCHGADVHRTDPGRGHGHGEGGHHRHGQGQGMGQGHARRGRRRMHGGHAPNAEAGTQHEAGHSDA